MTVQEAIENWVKNYKEKHFKLRIAGAIACALGSLVVLFLTWWIFKGVLFVAFRGITGTGLGLTRWTWGVLGMSFVAYLTLNYEELENLKFGPADHSRKARMVARATGKGAMSIFTNQETFHLIVKWLSFSILAGPALVMTGIRLAQTSRDAEDIDPAFIAPFLVQLAKAGKRIPMDKLAAELGDATITDLIHQMSLIEGVTIRTKENAGMYLTEGLKTSLESARKERTRDTD